MLTFSARKMSHLQYKQSRVLVSKISQKFQDAQKADTAMVQKVPIALLPHNSLLITPREEHPTSFATLSQEWIKHFASINSFPAPDFAGMDHVLCGLLQPHSTHGVLSYQRV